MTSSFQTVGVVEELGNGALCRPRRPRLPRALVIRMKPCQEEG
jgi:hypothetical protein